MAGAAFKQACPSCEHEIVIRNPAQIGKKIECPKCKYKVLVQKPAGGGSNGDADAKSKPGKADPAKAKGNKTKAGALRDVDDDDFAASEKKPKKFNLKLGVGLAAVGVLVLVGAYFFIFSRGGGGLKKSNSIVKKYDPEPEDPKGDPKVEPKVEVVKKELPKIDDVPAHLPGPQQTNLLPNDTEHVFHGFFKDLFDAVSPFRDRIVGDPHALLDTVFKPKIGFGISDVDDFIRAERFTGTPWTYTVIHLRTPVDQAAITDALGLQKMPAIKDLDYHKVTKQNPWFDQLGRVAIGVPAWLRALPRADRPLFVRFHDSNTFIVADEAPIQELLKNGGDHFPLTDVVPVAKKAKDNTEILNAVRDSKWIGSESRKTPPVEVELVFTPDGVAKVLVEGTLVTGSYSLNDTKLSATFGPLQYVGEIRLGPDGYEIVGGADQKNAKWTFTALRIGAADTITAKKTKGNFPAGTRWIGKETRPGNFGPLLISIFDSTRAEIETPVGKSSGEYVIANNNRVRLTFGPSLAYEGEITTGPAGALRIAGIGKLDNLRWKFDVLQVLSQGDPLKKIAASNPKIHLPQIHSRSYLTIKTKLKDVLDRMEAKIDDTKDRCLFSTATELDPARVPEGLTPPEYRGRFAWRGKQVWDLANLLDERKPRILVAGSGLAERDPKVFQYRAEFECGVMADARDVLTLSESVLAPEFARNFERYLRHKIEYPQPQQAGVDPKIPQPQPLPFQPQPGGQPEVPVVPPLPESSKWISSMRDESVDVRVDLVFDKEGIRNIQDLVRLFSIAARSEVDLVADPRGRHTLGQAATTVAKTGVPERKVPAGSFPPGVFPRPGASSKGGSSPYYRVSWMTSLLPYLGSDALSSRIDYNGSWRDPSNWLAARTIVPEFLDPSYPLSSRHVDVPGLGITPAATHVVGIAGVGLDAADYRRDDPATIKKRGVFGYDRSATLTEIGQGRGASSTIMMMQIPHDGLTGVSPWIAGGGSTLRGIPEKNSIAPFVLSVDKTGKPITQGGKKGTYAIMADGSVRFIDATISDDVLKAMATIHGPAATTDDEKVLAVPDPSPRIEPKVTPKTAPNDAKLEAAPPPEKK